jgi:hypothetical protein
VLTDHAAEECRTGEVEAEEDGGEHVLGRADVPSVDDGRNGGGDEPRGDDRDHRPPEGAVPVAEDSPADEWDGEPDEQQQSGG